MRISITKPVYRPNLSSPLLRLNVRRVVALARWLERQVPGELDARKRLALRVAARLAVAETESARLAA